MSEEGCKLFPRLRFGLVGRRSDGVLSGSSYRGLVACERDGTAVHGELYEVARTLIPRLDELEEAPTLFRLVPIEIEDMAEPVFAYLYQQDTRGFSQCRDGRADAPGDGP